MPNKLKVINNSSMRYRQENRIKYEQALDDIVWMPDLTNNRTQVLYF